MSHLFQNKPQQQQEFQAHFLILTRLFSSIKKTGELFFLLMMNYRNNPILKIFVNAKCLCKEEIDYLRTSRNVLNQSTSQVSYRKKAIFNQPQLLFFNCFQLNQIYSQIPQSYYLSSTAETESDYKILIQMRVRKLQFRVQLLMLSNLIVKFLEFLQRL